MDDFFEFLFGTVKGWIVLAVSAILLLCCFSASFLDCVCHNEKCAENCVCTGCYSDCEQDCGKNCNDCICYGCNHRTCTLCNCYCSSCGDCQIGTCVCSPGKSATVALIYEFGEYQDQSHISISNNLSLLRDAVYKNGKQLSVSDKTPEIISKYFEIEGYYGVDEDKMVLDKDGVILDDVALIECIRRQSSLTAKLKEKRAGNNDESEVLIKFAVSDELKAQGVHLNKLFANIGLVIEGFPKDPELPGKTFAGYKVVGASENKVVKIKAGDVFHLYLLDVPADAITIELEPVFKDSSGS